MEQLRPPCADTAFGQPGASPTWAHAAKQGLGTAAVGDSPLWFTLAEGVVTELFFPRVDVPNTRDLQFLVLLPGGRVLEERRDLVARVERLDSHALGYQVISSDAERRFELRKRIVTDTARPTLAMRVHWRPLQGAAAEPARLFLLLAPHMGGRGMGNSAAVAEYQGHTVLVAHRHDAWLALAASVPFRRASCGFAGASDGWSDLTRNGDMTWAFAAAPDGSVALTAELTDFENDWFTVAVGFGPDLEGACGNALATLARPYAEVEAAYLDGWRAWCGGLSDLSAHSGDGGELFYLSAMTLKAHEDKENPGAHIASLSVPWGEAQGDADAGGYHLVWPRDLYHSATARLACGDADGAVAALHYLMRTQRADGSWPQNFWVFGAPYWAGLQLDEVAFPILLAWQLQRAGALQFNAYPSLVAPAAYAVARIGPVTPEERWEEDSGYSPSTLAAAIAAMVCAAEFARDNNDPFAAEYFLDVADCWEAHIEDWTYTTQGQVLPGFREYYQRIATPALDGPPGLQRDTVFIGNRQPGQNAFEARALIDSGQFELVRYGVRSAADPHMLHSLQAYDAACKVVTPLGPAWHRYNHDGYGQKADGSAYDGSGVGRAWPLLTGERAHYELAAGRDATALRDAMEAFAAHAMLPEQVWDEPDRPAQGLRFGGPTGSAAPLCWAHAEYLKLLRSLRDGAVFDCPEPVRARYTAPDRPARPSIWKPNNRTRHVSATERCGIEVYSPATLHWSDDDWHTVHHDPLAPRGHGVWVRWWPAGALKPGAKLRFTFYWHERQAWEGQDFVIACDAAP